MDKEERKERDEKFLGKNTVVFELSLEDYRLFDRVRRKEGGELLELEYARSVISRELRLLHPDKVYPDKEYQPSNNAGLFTFTYRNNDKPPASFMVKLEEEDGDRLEAIRGDKSRFDVALSLLLDHLYKQEIKHPIKMEGPASYYLRMKQEKEKKNEYEQGIQDDAREKK